MPRCPNCGREYTVASNYTNHVRWCGFGQRVDEYDARLKEIKARAGKCYGE